MSRAIYLFRNIRTRQVVATTERSLLERPQLYAAQLSAPTYLPQPALRPDHWTPLVVATGFTTDRFLTNTFALVSQPGSPLVPPTERQKREYRLMKNKDKRIADRDTTERQVAQLARSLVYTDALRSESLPAGAKIKLLWQDRDWIKKVEDAGLRWPAWVEHGDLDLKRGNIILNPELRSSRATQSPN
ncbi:hypothetical protein LPJ73_005751 [Coemansia sp. RSA 2703]|nr:hypothetical protein LPJ73_005751 [Coemansia sp. RSA 2703]KAJ2376091.1 hypothetical protein IW150_002183 [Coemansia sp. RSA 2607]KAJ2385794.1 hypothetical protein GGI05_004585 [Coemansia sp. RSA 2603]